MTSDLLGRRGRVALLTAHHLLSAAWLGAITVSLVLLREQVRASFVVHDRVAMTAMSLVAVTGLLFSLLGPWGFVRVRWVGAKWALVIAAALVDVFFVCPELATAAAAADLGVRASHRGVTVGLLLELVLLVSSIVISVAKPFGKGRELDAHRRRMERLVVGVTAVIAACAIVAQVWALHRVRVLPIASVDPHAVEDGAHSGHAHLLATDFDVRVIVHGGVIERIDLVRVPTGHYPDLARGIGDKILRAQRIDVDAVSGATTTSRAIQKAVEAALR